jgi:arsenate reductase
MSSIRRLNVLFLCTGNSARSIMAEAMLRELGRERFDAFSAGSHPAGNVNPHAHEVLKRQGFRVDGLRSKSWSEFAEPGAAAMDAIITVCDNAAGEVCPVWPGRPVTAHWGVPDPASVVGDDNRKRQAFEASCNTLRERIEKLVALQTSDLADSTFQRKLREIGAA